MNCTEDSDKPHLIRVSRNEVQDPLKVVNIEIKHAKKKFKPRALSPKTRKKLEKKYDEEIKAELDSGNIERAEKLKNMTDEERQAFRAEMKAKRQAEGKTGEGKKGKCKKKKDSSASE